MKEDKIKKYCGACFALENTIGKCQLGYTLHSELKKSRLDIGSGRAHFEDYFTLDKDPSVKADICLDFENVEAVGGCIKYKSKDGKNDLIIPVDEIRAHHILEHFKPENKIKVMALCWDLLKEGGILDIEIPLFPHPASIQDPTHLSFWCKESFKYFTKGDPFGEAFAKRYSQYPVPLFEKVEDWYKGDKPNCWAYGIKFKRVIEI